MYCDTQFAEDYPREWSRRKTVGRIRLRGRETTEESVNYMPFTIVGVKH